MWLISLRYQPDYLSRKRKTSGGIILTLEIFGPLEIERFRDEMVGVSGELHKILSLKLYIELNRKLSFY